MTTNLNIDHLEKVSDETVCDYLFWVRRRLIYRALLEDYDRIDTGRCLSTQENRRVLAQMLEKPETTLSNAPPICRGSMCYTSASGKRASKSPVRVSPHDPS